MQQPVLGTSHEYVLPLCDFKASMLFIMKSTWYPDDKVAKFGEVFIMASEWRRDVNISIINLSKTFVFDPMLFPRIKIYNILDILPFINLNCIFFSQLSAFLLTIDQISYINIFKQAITGHKQNL